MQLVDEGKLEEALVVLRLLSNVLIQPRAVPPSQSEALETQQIMDLLAQALAGAKMRREESRCKLLTLRNDQQVKAAYSASSLPH